MALYKSQQNTTNDSGLNFENCAAKRQTKYTQSGKQVGLDVDVVSWVHIERQRRKTCSLVLF